MHTLNDDGSINTQLPGGNKCYSVSANRVKYGCTYYDGGVIGNPPIKAYPFTSDITTITIESDTTSANDSTQQGYLHNVVSQEMTAGAPLSSYAAQAIASRTYTYFFHTSINNNSASYHVYIPYRYEAVAEEGLPPGDRQQKINYAVTQSAGVYMSSPGSEDPIFAAYGQDNCVYTQDKSSVSPHLKSIYDPISEAENQPIPPQTVCNNDDEGRRTLDGGMGSDGAARWGYGNTNPYGAGADWGVQWGEAADIISGDSWQEAYRILTHYYSDIDIRNALGQILSPAYRWNPLILDWGNGTSTPPVMGYGGNKSYTVTVTLQNTGRAPWTHSSQGGSAQWYLSYRWRKDSHEQEGESKVEIIEGGQALTVLEGEHRSVLLSVSNPPDWGDGDYVLHLDMFYQVGAGSPIWFSTDQPQPWFTYDLHVPTSLDNTYLPLVQMEYDTLNNCTWEGNQLTNSTFIQSPAPLKGWTILTHQEDGFTNLNLYEGSPYYSPDSGAAAAFLGGQNDNHQPPNGDYSDQAIAQQVLVKDTQEVEAIRIAWSYCVVTAEPSPSIIKDQFRVDLQAGTLGSNSAFSTILTYSNINAHAASNSHNCQHNSGQWRRRERILYHVNQTYSGHRLFTLAFYSDVDEDHLSRFYFDTTEVNICRQ